jgi:hypothetical protein
MAINIANLGLMYPFCFFDLFRPNPAKKSSTCLKAGLKPVLSFFVWFNLTSFYHLIIRNLAFFIFNSFTRLKYEIKKEISSDESRKGKKHDFSRVQIPGEFIIVLKEHLL